jgi:hypothetical protein
MGAGNEDAMSDWLQQVFADVEQEAQRSTRLEAIAKLRATIAELEAQLRTAKAARLDCSQRWLNDASKKSEIIAQQAATIRELESLVKAFEWIKVEHGEQAFCPVCTRWKAYGHDEKCALASVLAKVPKGERLATIIYDPALGKVTYESHISAKVPKEKPTPAPEDTQSRGIPFRRS